MKKSGTGKSTSRIGEGPILTLERVERQQSGVYQCTADNNVGEPATVDMRLDVLCKFLEMQIILRKPQKPQFIIIIVMCSVCVCRRPHMLITFDFQSVWLSLKFHPARTHTHFAIRAEYVCNRKNQFCKIILRITELILTRKI